jgi:sigma-B regulation protein RsbU (phosphoserine phosphatase)
LGSVGAGAESWPSGFFESLVAHVDAAVICTDLAGALLYCNPTAERLYGIPAFEAIGRQSADLLGVEVSQKTRAEIGAALARGEVWDGDVSVTRPDGTTLILRTKDAGLYDTSGVLTGVVSIAIDVTERRRTEDELRASDARRNAMLEAGLDGIVSIDHQGLITEFNPAAEAMFGYTRSDVLGREMAEIIVPPALQSAHRAGLRRYLETGRGELLGQRIEISAVDRAGREFPVELAITRIDLPGPPSFMGSLRDISARRATEQALLDSREHFVHLARTLQSSLLPPVLPEVPGFDVAVGYRPAGEGDEVGGDFYDLFETAQGDWAVVIGDVQGKGAEAAALTALVRYTVRAAAMRADRPSTILRIVNDAILHQRVDRLCTVAYARLRSSSDDRVTATLSVGGHPLPLHARRDGDVRPAGRLGTLLGALADIALDDCDVELEPGDSLVLYTDGVTDARAAADQFGEDRLVALISRMASQSVTASELATGIEAAVAEFDDGRHRDDMAVVVLQRSNHPFG